MTGKGTAKMKNENLPEREKIKRRNLMELTLKQGKLSYETPKLEVTVLTEDVVTTSVGVEGNPDWE